MLSPYIFIGSVANYVLYNFGAICCRNPNMFYHLVRIKDTCTFSLLNNDIKMSAYAF